MASIDTILNPIFSKAGSLAANALGLVPNLVVAIILVGLGWVVAVLLRRWLLWILNKLNFENFLKQQGVHRALGNVVISDLLALVLYYYIIIIFLQAAVDTLYLKTITVFMTQVLNYLPAVVGAVLLFVAAALIGEFVKRRILVVGEKNPSVQMVARGTKFLIMYIGLVMALDTVGFNTTILNNLLVNLSTAVFYGVALAFGIAFGFGGQDSAKDWIKTLRARFRV